MPFLFRILHLIPVRRKVDGKPGMYDVLNDVFYAVRQYGRQVREQRGDAGEILQRPFGVQALHGRADGIPAERAQGCTTSRTTCSTETSARG